MSDIFYVVSVHLPNNLLTPYTGTLAAPVKGTSLIITGLNANTLVSGIVFRPSNNLLYGLAFDNLNNTIALITINTTTGAATYVSGLTTSVSNTSFKFGFSIDPVSDEIRVTTIAGENFTGDPDTGVFFPQTNLNPISYDPSNAIGSSYTNKFVGAVSTTLYDIITHQTSNTSADIYIQNPQNLGTLVYVATALTNADGGTYLGFDILSNNSNTGFLAIKINSDGAGTLYSVNLTTGSSAAITSLTLIASEIVTGLALLPGPLVCIHPDMYVTVLVDAENHKNGGIGATKQKKVKDVVAGDYLLSKKVGLNSGEPVKVAINHINVVPHTRLVKFEKNSIAAGIPSHDLFLTAKHSLWLDDNTCLKARSLINNGTIMTKRTKVQTHTIVTETGEPILVNNVPVSTWKLSKWPQNVFY
jgi:hypothetical protein